MLVLSQDSFQANEKMAGGGKRCRRYLKQHPSPSGQPTKGINILKSLAAPNLCDQIKKPQKMLSNLPNDQMPRRVKETLKTLSMGGHREPEALFVPC